MRLFDYSAYDRKGKLQRGVIEAESDQHARKLLLDTRLLPESVTGVGLGKKIANLGGARKSRVNNLDLSLILRQQALLIQSGLPLEDALRMTGEQAETDNQRRLVRCWRSDIMEGRSFSDALVRCPYHIPQSVIAGVEVGEESGHLHSILLRMADDLEASAENRKNLSRSLLYPATLVATAVLVLAIMMVWVVPKITAVFASSKRELPLITQLVVGVSEFFQAFGLQLLAMGAGAILLLHYLLRDESRREKWHQLQLRLPVVKRWILMANIADWSRSLGVLLASGVPALSALKIASSAIDNLFIRREMQAVTEQVRRGSSLQKALQKSALASGHLVYMVGSGEASSELDKMLLRVADFYRTRLSNSVAVFLGLINPALIVFMGIIILSIIAAVMLPIMDMNNMI